MKKVIQLVALLLAALFLLTSCNITPSGKDDSTTADTTLSAPDDTTTGGNNTTVGDPDDTTVPDNTTTGADDTTTGADDTTTGANEPEGPNDEPNVDMAAGGTVVNVDGDALYYCLRNANWDISKLEETLIDWFDYHYANGGVTDMLYDIAASAPYADKTLIDKIDLYDPNVDKNNGNAASYLIYVEAEVDAYQVWFDRCTELGINPWISFRMNDVHYADSKYANAETNKDPFVLTAKQNGWFIGSSRAGYWLNNSVTAGSRKWYPYALNYEIPQVREHFLKIIDDRLSTYDVYGIELDFQRQIWCFPNDTLENCRYMNEFMEDVNEIVEKYEAIYGHDIKIAPRINRDIDHNKYFGFDARYWAENDLVDVIIPSCYYGSSDSDMPIDKWVEELGKYGVEIWAGLECDVLTANQYHSNATLAAYSAQYYCQGAKKIYLFNLFGYIGSNFIVCSSLENALAYEKRSYVVTEANCAPYGVKGITQWDPLPMNLKVNTPQSLVINHGILDYEKDVIIYVGFKNVEETDMDEYLITLTYNGVECEFEGITNQSYVDLKGSTQYGTVVAYRVPAEAAQGSLKGEIVFDPGMNCTVSYIELMNGTLS